jgi:hypothetical protein
VKPEKKEKKEKKKAVHSRGTFEDTIPRSTWKDRKKPQSGCPGTSQCTTSASGDKSRRMLKVIRSFGKHRSCHLQGKHVLVCRFWQSYIG